jgi:hypothetical protein
LRIRLLIFYFNRRILEGMKDLCTRFCREELLAATGADEYVKDTHSQEALEGDEYYEQEEMEEMDEKE